MARIFSINRAEKSVAEISGGIPTIGTKFQGHGWAILMDENVDYDVAVRSDGPRPVRVLLSKPAGFFDADMDTFAVVETSQTFNPENEDLFVLAQVQGEDGVWRTADGSQGHSDQVILNEGSEASGVSMSWDTQGLVCSIRAH